MKVVKITCKDCDYTNERAWDEGALIAVGECPRCNPEMEMPYPGHRVIQCGAMEYEKTGGRNENSTR